MSMKYIPQNVRFGVEVCRRVWIVLITICNVEYFSSTAMCGLQEVINKNSISEPAELFLHKGAGRFVRTVY